MKLCSIYQDIISFQLDAGKSLPGWLKNHCANCEDCRAYRHEQTALISRLESDAHISMESPPPFLHGRIMSTIERAEPVAEPTSRLPKPVWLGLAGVATAVALSLLMFKSGSAPGKLNPGPSGQFTVSSLPEENIYEFYSLAKLAPIEKWSADLNKPLEDEMKRAISDAKTAINALADTFLSEEMKESLLVASQN